MYRKKNLLWNKFKNSTFAIQFQFNSIMAIPLLKKVAFSLIVIFLGIGKMYSQLGCTDPLANNYDPNASQNDGSCIYDPVTLQPTNSYELDEVLAETSGLVYWNNSLWTQNDSGDINLYELDPSNGTITNSVSLASQINVDWEEISQDENYIYVGDFGNNVNGNRTDLKILRVTKASIAAGTAIIDTINFAYEDQVDFTPQGANNTDYDCEAFIISDDAIFLFTKEWVSNATRVYKLPKTPGTYQAELQDTFNIEGLVTGSVFKRENGIIALSGYNSILQPFVFLLYDFTAEDFFGANKRKLALNLPFHQVEGITTQDGLNYFITNEKFNTTGTPQKLHSLNLTPYLEGYLSIPSAENIVQFKIFPNPTTSNIEIKDTQNLFPIKYIVLDVAAKKIMEGTLSTQNSRIDISELAEGTYILKLGEKIINSFRVLKK